MDELFTDSAKAVLAIAQEEAKYFRHQSVGSEHLLLALVLEPNGIAGKTLRQLNADKNDIREEIEHLPAMAQLKVTLEALIYLILLAQSRFLLMQVMKPDV
jgi:ATP-dependent Clp protease ATP-binding subunit ClpC